MTDRQRWLTTVILVGVIYVVVAVGTAALAGAAATIQARNLWRWSAFAISAVVFVAQLAFEVLRLRTPTRPAAWHAGLASALGGFGLALIANIHDLGSASGYRSRMLIALVAWPLLTGVPALVVALALAAGLGAKRP